MAICCRAEQEAFQRKVRTTFDLGEAAKGLPNNRPAWVCTEVNQQTSFSCKKCNVVVNILGEYGNCPSCGKRNYALVFARQMQTLEVRFAEAEARIPKTERQRREEEWKSLLERCVSQFDSLGNDIRAQLLRIPAPAKRKKALAGLSFQGVLRAHALLKGWHGIKTLDGFALDDRAFLNKMFNRRHLVSHTGGRVDMEYLTNTRDASVRLNETIHVHSNEIRRLIGLVRKAGENLISGYESLG